MSEQHRENFKVSQPNKNRIPWFRRSWVAVLGFGFLALLIRLPFLQRMPAFIESNELRITLDLVSGDRFPLNDFRPYLGALNNYITAICFKILGLHYWVPRTIPLMGGVLTVSLTYLLAKRMFGPRPATIAAILMAACAYPVFFLSHICWPNSITPFFTTASLLCFVMAIEDARPAYLVASTFLMGLALQTHPSAVTLVPAMILVFALQRKALVLALLRKPATYLAIPAAALGYANMIYYFLSRSMAVPAMGLGKANKYAVAHQHTIDAYLTNFKSAEVLLLRLLSGSVQDRPSPISYLADPAFVFCSIGLISGIILCFHRRKLAFPLLVTAPMLIIPYINEAYDFFNFGRYLGFLIPLACAGTAFAVTELLNSLGLHFPKWKPFVPALLVVLTCTYVATQIAQLALAYGTFEITGNSTAIYEQIRTSLTQFDKKQTVVLLDGSISKMTPIKIYLESDGWTVDTVAWPARDRDTQDLSRNWKWRVKSLDPGRTPVEVMSPHSLNVFFHTDRLNYFTGCVVDFTKPEAKILSCFVGGPALFGPRRRHSQHHAAVISDQESEAE